MNTPKFKVGDRVKWIADDGRELSGVVAAVTASGQVLVKENADDRFVSWWHESHLSLDVPLAPKFKVGARVKWKDMEGFDRIAIIRAAKNFPSPSYQMSDGSSQWWHESFLSLDVPAEPKFKVRTWVKYTPRGLSGFITNAHADGSYTLETTIGLAYKVPGDQLSLDVPEPKRYGTDMEARLGAEIIKQHKAIIDLSNRLTEEIGGRARERIAKEAAQKELAEAKAAQRSVNEAYVDAVGKWHEAQKRNSKLSTKLADITRIVGTP